MDAHYYLETIKVVFQEYSLVNGTWDVIGVDGKVERVRPQDIKTTALFSVEGELDDISGSGQTQAVHDICSGVPRNLQKHYEAKGAGHYGIFSGKRWRELVYPQVKSFILEHNTSANAKAAAPAPVKSQSRAVSTSVSSSKPAATKVAAKPVAAKKVATKRLTSET
jgi:poly(3-hydroxybutyrate) depolymerase